MAALELHSHGRQFYKKRRAGGTISFTIFDPKRKTEQLSN